MERDPSWKAGWDCVLFYPNRQRDICEFLEQQFLGAKMIVRAAVLAVCTLVASNALASEAKVTVLYGHPTNKEEFDKYYAEKHMPMVYAVKEVKRVEIAKPLPPPNGGNPPYYIITEIWFESLDAFKAVAATPEWKAIGADVPKFATGGATPFVSVIETQR
jgi:uncharacterized protein (TIGR02118 family)